MQQFPPSQQQQQQQQQPYQPRSAGVGGALTPVELNKVAVLTVIGAVLAISAVATPAWYSLDGSGLREDVGLFKTRTESSGFTVNCPIQPFSCTIHTADCDKGGADADIKFATGADCGRFQAAQGFGLFGTILACVTAAAYVTARATSGETTAKVQKAAGHSAFVTLLLAFAAAVFWIIFVQDSDISDSSDDGDDVTRYYSYSYWLMAVAIILFCIGALFHRSAARRAASGHVPLAPIGPGAYQPPAAYPQQAYPQQAYPQQAYPQQQYAPQQTYAQQQPQQQQQYYAPPANQQQ